MMNNGKRDDSLWNRLLLFLKQKGFLSIKNVQRVKAVNFIVTDDADQKFVLKGYQKQTTVLKQWELFSQIDQPFIVSFQRFPSGDRYLFWEGYYWTLQKYYRAQRLNYQWKKDRDQAWSSMKQFHQAASGIVIEHQPPTVNFVRKWENRLRRWQNTEQLLYRLGYRTLYNELETQLMEGITLFQQVNHPTLEANPSCQLNWIHGDVASHNFLRDNRNNIYLIDFDLLAPSPSIYDEIQLAQRFLPFIQDDIEQLEAYIHPDTLQTNQLFWIGVMIPADFIREWWYFIVQSKEEIAITNFLTEFCLSWNERKQFVETVKKKLNR